MDKAIDQLELQLQELSALCATLYDENTNIKQEQRIVTKECEQLREKNRIARGRVEQIVERLKELDDV